MNYKVFTEEAFYLEDQSFDLEIPVVPPFFREIASLTASNILKIILKNIFFPFLYINSIETNSKTKEINEKIFFNQNYSEIIEFHVPKDQNDIKIY